MKRLRKRYPQDKIRYLVRGEYGGAFGRPHFHVILFGFCCSGVEECGYRLSDEWRYGGVYVDTYSDRAVQYVTDYILKSDDMSVYKDEEIVFPYINVSQRPPIGSNFLDSKTAERAIRTNDYVILDENGNNRGIPRYIAKKMDESVTDNVIDANYRRYSRCVVYGDKEITHYSDDYLLSKQVERAQAIKDAQYREYLRSKSKK